MSARPSVLLPAAAPNVPLGMLALVALLYFVGAKLSMVALMPAGMAILWLPNAVVLAAMLRFGSRSIPALGLVALATEVLANVPTFSVAESLLFALLNFAEVAFTFLLLRRLGFDPRMPTLADAWKFVLAGPLVVAVITALLGAALYRAFGGTQAGYFELARSWWFGDATGLLLLTPLLLAFPPFGAAPATPAPRWRPTLVDAAFLAAVLLTLTLFWFSTYFGTQLRAFLFLPLSLVAAARYAQRWAPLAAASVAVVVVLAMAAGRDPFGPLPPGEAALTAQAFLFIVTLTTLGFAALLGELRRNEAELLARVAERTRELQDANRRLERMATVDPLTGVGNRRLFDQSLDLEAERARRYAAPLSLVLLDLDHFKRVNDTRGHAAGDEVLCQVARALWQCARGTDVVARFGGEEFAVILPHTTREQALCFAERARRAVAGLPARVTASVGAAQLKGSDDPTRLLAAADQALYQAKAAGRDRVVAAGD